MTMHVRDGGTWKEITDPQVNIGGTWKEIASAWVNVGGVWKQFYERIALSLPTVTETVIASPSAAGVRVRRNGKYESGTAAGNQSVVYGEVDAAAWADPEESTIGDEYHCRLVTSSGSLDVGTADSWLALTSDRSFEVVEGGSFFGEMQLSKDGGSTILATGSVSLTASPL